MSKTFGMAGVRTGWVVTRDTDVFARMAAMKDYTTICASAPSEILSIIALRAKDKIIDHHLTRIRRNLGLLDSFFADFHERFEWTRPRAGTIAFPRLKGDENTREFCQRLVREASVLLLPSSVYDYDGHHFRLGFGRENMPEALEKLREYLNNKNQG
jgi:aspartate/methionine/tyrosine aminotransferase